MNNLEKEELYFSEAKKRISRIKAFYLHLALYVVAVLFIVWNLLIIEDSDYTNYILALNYSTIFIWGLFVVILGIRAYKQQDIFTKKWEKKNLEKFTRNNPKRWE
ncbi:2TM domain-containing protein [Winogradskyella litorisediminis]|uniref:2TM domain-containing protein n=1 Tax=Winogradskyella litorisediminis TaxID=1156618 RepID=A0ABW3NB73_9FLAO